jgi:hypothetical protein
MKKKKQEFHDQIPHKKIKSDRYKMLEMVGYKDGTIISRLFDNEIFVWDVIWNGQMYSGHFIVTLDAGQSVHTNQIINEVTQMCYAGAATTIDMLRGENEIDEKQKQNVAMFESVRDKVDKAN